MGPRAGFYFKLPGRIPYGAGVAPGVEARVSGIEHLQLVLEVGIGFGGVSLGPVGRLLFLYAFQKHFNCSYLALALVEVLFSESDHG